MRKIILLAYATLSLLASQTLSAESLSGNYRCWHFNVGGRGGSCTSPAILFYPDGRYQMSSEKGTYSVKGNGVTLSKSKHRGEGAISGEQIQFEYDYKGNHHTVTYLRQGDVPAEESAAKKPSGKGCHELELTVSCAASGSAVDWINTCSLDCGDGNRYDALAVQKDHETLNCWHRQVPANRSCSVTVGSGFDSKVVGSVETSGSCKQTLRGTCAW